MLFKNRDDRHYDRLFKLRPLLDRLRCLAVDPEKKQSIDEQIIQFKGRANFVTVCRIKQRSSSKSMLDAMLMELPTVFMLMGPCVWTSRAEQEAERQILA